MSVHDSPYRKVILMSVQCRFTQRPWIPFITSFLQASHFLATPGVAHTLWATDGKLWVVTALSKWRACHRHVMVEESSWALCGLTEALYAVFNTVLVEVWHCWSGDNWCSLQRIMYFVWQNVLPFIQCGMIVADQLFVCVLWLYLWFSPFVVSYIFKH
jgi:hypothetical protein